MPKIKTIEKIEEIMLNILFMITILTTMILLSCTIFFFFDFLSKKFDLNIFNLFIFTILFQFSMIIIGSILLKIINKLYTKEIEKKIKEDREETKKNVDRTRRHHLKVI